MIEKSKSATLMIQKTWPGLAQGRTHEILVMIGINGWILNYIL